MLEIDIALKEAKSNYFKKGFEESCGNVRETYSAKRATVSTRPRFLTNFLKIHSMVVQERRGNLVHA